MTIKVNYNELIDDLIDNRISKCEDYGSMVNDLLRFGHEGYINETNQSLIDEAIKRNIYGEEVDEIIINE